MTYKTGASLLSLCIVMIGISCFAGAQTAPQASLRGIVTDPSGARLPEATVVLRGQAGEQTQRSDANGQYAFAALAPGRYDVQVTAPNFKSDQRQAFNV